MALPAQQLVQGKSLQYLQWGIWAAQQHRARLGWLLAEGAGSWWDAGGQTKAVTSCTLLQSASPWPACPVGMDTQPSLLH